MDLATLSSSLLASASLYSFTEKTRTSVYRFRVQRRESDANAVLQEFQAILEFRQILQSEMRAKMLGGSLAAANQKRCAHTSQPPFNPRRWSSFPHPSALTRFTFKEGTPTPADYTQANIGTALEQGGVDQTEQSEEENPEWIQAGRSGSGSEPSPVRGAPMRRSRGETGHIHHFLHF